ncbi:hypothetical protein FOL46_001765 [Perkinsus olseni]|uniref:Uncharacterized protein n=1 Tax=Perkinsus olseni TaxID=32597 RepID=A0A7J6MBH7_PEROL|nr:hypothetical protein FOL46_001765 [Perkinsus olseni]
MWQLKKYEGADSKRSIKLYFIIGDSTELNSDQKATLEEEKKQYGISASWGTNEASTPSLMSDDIRELKGFHDRYGRLGQKVLEIFKVCSDIFGEYRLLLKSDTDSYVHVDRHVKIRQKNAFDLPRVHAGTFWHSSPILQQSLKDSTGLKEYPLNARGAGYILSRDLVEFMANTQIPVKHMEAEDAMIGTILAPYDGTAKETYQADHYNTFETLRWKQRRYEMFGDSCWRMESPQESSCRRATLPAGGGQKFYFDAITTAMIPDGVVVPDHTSTRDGVCKISFQWKADGWSGCSKECGGGVRTRCIKCSGPNGHAYDDVECDANTRPSEEEPCNDHPCPEGFFLGGGVAARVKKSVSSWLASPSGPPLYAFFIISLVVILAFGGLQLTDVREVGNTLEGAFKSWKRLTVRQLGNTYLGYYRGPKIHLATEVRESAKCLEKHPLTVGAAVIAYSAPAVVKQPNPNLGPSLLGRGHTNCPGRDRQALRHPTSWMWQLKKYGGADSKRSIKLYFIIGDSTELNSDQKATLEEERKQYGISASWGTNEASTPSLMSDDIRELKGFHDRYGRLGQKVLEIFKVCSDIFGEYRLLLKSDTDSYVHVDRHVKIRQKNAFDLPRVHAGTFWHSSPILQQSLKDSTGLKEYPLNARGAGYILSRDLVEFMANTQIPVKHMEAEDAMIGTILAPYDYNRIEYEVSPSTPQCGCSITCSQDTFGTAEETYQVDHYNTVETLRWKQRRYEMFGDSCWRMESPQESSCRRATLPAGGGQKFYFDAITTAMIPDGVVVPDHTSTRDGVCKISFQWKADGWSGCSKECGGGVRTRCIKCSGPNGHAYDDVECDANTRPSEEEPCNDQWSLTTLALREPSGVVQRLLI